MKRIADWLRTWSVPQAIVASVALICITALTITITVQDDWGRLFRWLADPATSGLLISVVTLGGVLYHRALGLPPSVLVLAFLGVGVLGCGAQLTDPQRVALTVETQRCLLTEREIIDRAGTTEEQDRADLAIERARCDAARAAIVRSP